LRFPSWFAQVRSSRSIPFPTSRRRLLSASPHRSGPAHPIFARVSRLRFQTYQRIRAVRAPGRLQRFPVKRRLIYRVHRILAHVGVNTKLASVTIVILCRSRTRKQARLLPTPAKYSASRSSSRLESGRDSALSARVSRTAHWRRTRTTCPHTRARTLQSPGRAKLTAATDKLSTQNHRCTLPPRSSPWGISGAGLRCGVHTAPEIPHTNEPTVQVGGVNHRAGSLARELSVSCLSPASASRAPPTGPARASWRSAYTIIEAVYIRPLFIGWR
jgi:hypothetical protein